MRIRPMGARLEWTDLVAVRLLRRWAAARDASEPQLPSLVELSRRLDRPAELAVALGSLFQLVEGCIGRPLRAESCCSARLGADERAILLMIAAAPEPSPPFASGRIPHGLPGALAWAASAVRAALGTAADPAGPWSAECPFATARERATEEALT